jgi:CheY-like chemotaxis protein
MDGFSLADAINSDRRIVGITILMISSADRSTFAERLKHLRVDGYLAKPVTKQRLLDALAATGRAFPPNEPVGSDTTQLSEPMHILVVDDTPANQKVVQAILRKRGHSVTLATNGRDAIDKIATGSFAVVLMDVQMPTLDGYQATKTIRKFGDAKIANTPIIALTAHAMRGDADKCLEVGMNGYISKPINLVQLIELVEYWGRRSPIRDEPRSSEGSRGAPASPV